MTSPPTKLDGANCLEWAIVGRTKPAGRLRLFIEDVRGRRDVTGSLPNIAIAHYPQRSGDAQGAYYVFVCDEQWNVVQDIDVESVDDGKRVVAEEYGEVRWNS